MNPVHGLDRLYSQHEYRCAGTGIRWLRRSGGGPDGEAMPCPDQTGAQKSAAPVRRGD